MSQLVGTIRIQWSVRKSSTIKMRPLTTHSTSKLWCNHWEIETYLGLAPGGEEKEFFLAVQWAAGFRSSRTWSPLRTMSTMKNMFKKCCHPNHAGMPVGATSGCDA